MTAAAADEKVERTIRTSFRISEPARSRLAELVASTGNSRKDEIDVLAVDLYHPDPEFVSALDSFIVRAGVPKEAIRKSQTVSDAALDLICRKAEELGVGRDQVIQQAILFRYAVVVFSTGEYQLICARTELHLLELQVRETRDKLNQLLGADHRLVSELHGIVRAVERLAA